MTINSDFLSNADNKRQVIDILDDFIRNEYIMDKDVYVINRDKSNFWVVHFRRSVFKA